MNGYRKLEGSPKEWHLTLYANPYDQQRVAQALDLAIPLLIRAYEDETDRMTRMDLMSAQGTLRDIAKAFRGERE